jgi:hypothetical protein
MTVIAQDVFTIAMNLMDEVSQDGTFTGYPDDYKKKSWSILTVLQAELLPANATPITIINELTPFQIDDRSAMTILPYGLAAHLLLTEDMNRASFFNNTFDELKRKRPAIIVPITDVYGVNAGVSDDESDSEVSFASGTTVQRPTTGIDAGFTYFDTTLNKPIWRNASNDGWVDATGATV